MRSALLLTALVASALAGPTGYRESCPVHCNDDIIFSYQPGRSYEYQYTVNTNTALLGDSEKGAEVTITANAHIDVNAPCDYALRLTEVKLHGSSHATEMEAALTRSALRFSFQDGRVEELCASPDEEAWVLNLKRGVLSAFQTSLTQPGTQEVQETDVQGVCTTHYKNILKGDILSVLKVKDINSCTKRADLTSYLTSAHYNTDSSVQSLPILDTTSSCSQTVQGGILIESTCEEIHSFRPFSRESGGASTTATNTLKLVSRDVPILTIPEQQHFIRRTPVFETDNDTPNTQVETVTALLTQLDQASNEEVRPEAPALFSRLVIALRGLDYPTLSRVNTATTQTHIRKFLTDAMPLVGTAAAAAVVRDMYVNGDLTQEDTDAWFTSLTFLKNPTSDMFTAIAPMLETNPSQAAMLGTSALVNTFCKTNSMCDQDTGVQQVMRRIEAQLGSGCRAMNEEQKVKILVALRALGNAGRWVNANHVLQRCYTEDNDMEVRIAAIQAWRHTPCQYDRSNLLALYQDDTQDSEARIAAYLSVMTCPTPSVVATIKDRLTSEGVSQVGSFVWTHLTNLQESAAPGKEWTRELLGEELLVNKFKTEALRFSRNYESSFFMKELNLGGAVESNVIFSSKSYLPRSAMLNLTLDLFGESVNLFEVGGRIEGFEAYIERLFGPDGYYPEDTIAAALQGLRKQKREAETTTLEQFLEEATDEPRGSYYLRLFGNDVHYRHFSGLSGHSEASPSPLALLMELARGGNVDYTKSYQLLDTHFSVPTITGLPLTLGAKSTATLALRMDGSFKLQSLSDVHIEGNLRPSAAVNVDGVMLVDAHVTRAGVKVSSTMHTSTSLQGKVRINGGTLVDVSFDTPKDRTEILDFDTKYFYVRDNQDEEKEKEEPVHTRCINTYMGMEVCGEISIPSSSSSSCFTLPSTLRAYLTKTDTQTGYTFRYTKTSNEISIMFNNPGGRRSLHTALKLQAQDTKMLVSLDSFLTKVEAQGEYMWQSDKKGVKGDVEINGKRYMVETGLMTPSGSIIKVEPYFKWFANGEDLINMRALAIADVLEHKYSLETDVNIFRVPYLSFKASVECAPERHLMDMTFSVPAMDMKFDLGGKISYDTSSIKTDVTVKYTEGRNNFNVNSILLLNKEHEGDATTYSSHLTLEHSFTDNPIILEYKYTTSPSTFNTFMHLKFGTIDMVVDEKWTHTYENRRRMIKGEVTSKCEFLDMDQHTSTEIIIEPNAFYLNSVVNRKGDIGNSIQTLLIDLRRDPSTSLTGRITFEGPHSFNANANFMKVNPGHYTGKVKAITRNPFFGERVIINANAAFKDNSQPGTYAVNVDGSIKLFRRSMSLVSDIYGDSQKAKMMLKTLVQGKEYGVHMEATRNSILVDADVFKHIVVNAKINNDTPKKMLLVNVEWDKETNPNNAFKIEGNIEPTAMAATFKFMEKEFSVSGKCLNGDLQGEVSWSPDQRVAGTLSYSLDGPLSLTANVDTTFPGWEKQSLNINTSLQDSKVTCRASAIWKNSQQGTLVLDGEVESGGSVYANAALTSTITSLERLSFSFKHQMTGIAIRSSLQGSWNDRELNGSLQMVPSDSGMNGLVTFTSPFTYPFKAVLHHELKDSSMNSEVSAKYGKDLLQITANGQLNLEPANHEVDLTFRVTTAIETLSDAKVTINYILTSSDLTLVVDANAGKHKMMLSVNGNKTMTPENNSISGEVRFLTPFTHPFTASLSHTNNAHEFRTQFETTRFWSTYSFGSLKLHAEGHVRTNDINLSTHISSPETKGSFSFIYKLENNDMTAEAKMYSNKELLSILVKGTIDPTARLIQLEGHVTSAYEELEMKVNVDSRKEGNTQNTRVDLRRGRQHAILSHSFTATDPLNWENVLSFNDQYSLTNKMVRQGDQYQHKAEIKWNDQRYAFDGRFTPVLTARERKFDAHIGLNTPWESLDNTNIDFHYEKETGGETKVSGEIEYKPGNKIQVETINKYNHEGKIFSMGSLTTPFWKPLGYKLDFTMRPDKKALLVFNHGQNETTVSGEWECRQDMSKVIFDLVTPSLQYPLHLEGSYLVTSPSKIMNVVAIYHHKYEAQVTFSGSITNTACDLALREYIKEYTDAWRTVHHLEGRWQHQLETTPINVNTALQVDSSIYKADVTIDKTFLTTKMVLNGREGSLDARWLLQPTNSGLEVVFQSPVDIIKNFNMGLKYDVEAIKGETRMKYDTHEINLLAKMEGQTFIFEGKTPFNGWEVLGASFFASGTAINGYVSRNERKIEVIGTQRLREEKGKVELVITTPYQEYETISFDASYKFHEGNRTIQFKTVYGTSEIFAKGAVKIIDAFTSSIILNVSTPFSNLRTLRASADWSLIGDAKSAKAKVVYNEQEFSWNMNTSIEGNTHQLISKAITPYPEWKTASLKVSISATESPYQVSVTVEKDGVTKIFSGKLNLNDNNLQGEIKTPIPGCEVVAVEGTYSRTRDTFSSDIFASLNNERYGMKTDISFSPLAPKIKVEVTTPYTKATNLKLEMESSLSGPQKTLQVKFTMNEMIFSAETTFKLENKTGFFTISINSPIPGFSTLQVEGNYDLRRNIKKSEVNVTKEGKRQHYAIVATLDNNHIVLDLTTPFQGYQEIKMDADYTSNVPGQHLLVADFTRDNEIYNFRGSVEIEPTGIQVKFNTPIAQISRVVLITNYELLNGAAKASIHLARNDDVFELKLQSHLTPRSSNFSAVVVTPVPEWNNMEVNLKYKVKSNQITAEASMQRDDFIKKVSIEALYGPEQGSLTLHTPLAGWEVLGAEYMLTMTNNKEATAYINVIHNDREFSFSANGRYTQDGIALRFRTPFQGYEESSMEATINKPTNNIKANLQIGSYIFSANGSYTIGNMFLEITTPLPGLLFGSIAIKHNIRRDGLEGSITAVHNQNNYFLTVETNVSPRSSLFLLRTKTPILALPNGAFGLRYNLDNKAELVVVELTVSDRSYNLLLAGDLRENLATAKIEMTTPFTGWSQVKVESKIDLTQDDKTIDVVLEREGSIKAISVHGKLLGTDLNFDLRTPFTGLNRVNVSGNINRAKRSLEFQMMNDAGEASILASFNSMKFTLKTPFARMEEVSFQFKKEGNTYEGLWKRNDNYLKLEITKDPDLQTVDVEVKSELQGWEFLALAGRLDHDTEEAYAKGQINERKVELAIKGHRNDRRKTRNITLDLKTPYSNYNHVTGELKFSPRRSSIKIESNSSDFKVDMSSSSRSGFHAEVIVPNPSENTHLEINMKGLNGNIDFTSRFEILRSLHYKSSMNMDRGEIKIEQNLHVNGKEAFKLEFHGIQETDFLHLDIHFRFSTIHVNLHIHREGFKIINIILKSERLEDGRTIEKELSMKMSGTGDLPTMGTIDATFHNSFVPVPRTTTIHAEIDRTSPRKHVKLEVTLPGRKLYIIDLNYDINLMNPTTGDFKVRINTPDRSAAPWKNFSGSWDLTNPQEAKFELDISGRKYRGEGSLSLFESNIVLTAQESERIFLQWKFHRNGDHRDYYLKVGPTSSYIMLKLRGSIQGIERGNVEGGFKLHFQPEELLFTSSWNRDSDRKFTGEGNYTYGQFRGTHKLTFHRDPPTKSATFEFTATSNHSRYRNINLKGNYDVLDKLVFKAELNADGRESEINIDISDFNPQRSRNSVKVKLPFLPPEFQEFHMKLNHNLQKSKKYIKAEAQIGQQKSHLTAEWTRSDDFSVLEGNLDINSMFIGEVSISMMYNVANINDANAEVHYKRAEEGQPEKKVDVKWSRKRTSDHLETELTLDTTFERLQHARAYAKADFSQLFNLNAGLDFNDKHITIVMNVTSENVQIEITTPFDGFENVKGSITYNLGGKTQKINLNYERGSQKANMDLTLNKKSKKKGDLTLILTTPFEVLRLLQIEAKWNRREATVEYVRNDVRVSMTGSAQLDTSKSEFNLSFTAPSGKSVNIAAAYDVEKFIAGRGSGPTKLAGLAVDIGETKIKFELKGFRSDERLYVEVDGESSFMMLRNLHLKLDSELNTQKRQGTFEFSLNEFVFNVHNEFERYENNGFYIKSRVESSLTPLPALVFGFGKKGDEYIFTLGYGEDKELTFSIKAKNHFRSGFSGSVDIPNFGYDGVQYDVTYHFPTNDQLKIHLEAKLGRNENLEAEFEYNSEGVEARLWSPFTGKHSARIRRSISADRFYSEIGFNDYNLRLRGGFNDNDIKRGAVLEADILGKKFFLNYQLQSEGARYTEGKLILQTPFRGWEKMGGLFTFSNVNKKIVTRSEIFVPFFLNIPRIAMAADLDYNKNMIGEMTMDVAGEKFILRSNVVGTSLSQGLQGSIMLETPFHALPSLEVAGKIKMSSLKNMEADLKITNIYTTYEVDFTYDVTPNQIKADVSILPLGLVANKISVIIEGIKPTQNKIELRIDSNYVVGEYKVEPSSFIINVDTSLAGIQRQLSVKTQYSTLDDLEGTVIAILGEERHKVHGALSITSSRMRGEVVLDSSFIGGVRKLEFNTTVPDMSFEVVSFSVSLTAKQVYSFSLDLDTRAGVVATTVINTPALPTTTVNLDLTWNRAAVTATTPSATHKAAVSWRQTRRMPSDQIVNAELDTPLLGQRYVLRTVMGGGLSKAVLKAELEVGSVAHKLEANTFMGSTNGGFSLNIQTPFMDIKKAALEGSIAISNIVELQAEASMRDITNTFTFIYNPNKGTLLAEAVSPYIPTGLVKATAKINNAMPNLNLQVSLMNAQDVISGRFDINIPSLQDATIRASISTPLESLKTFNFLIKYQMTDTTHIVVSLDHPITFRAEAKFGNTDDKFSGNLTVKTSIENFEYVEADIEIPLTNFSPLATLTLPNNKYGIGASYGMEGYLKKASATLYLDDQTYGGNLSFRNKAPYELAYKYNIFRTNSAFHLRTDSSFLTYLL